MSNRIFLEKTSPNDDLNNGCFLHEDITSVMIEDATMVLGIAYQKGDK